jgi:hypothetical protein
MIPGLKVMTPKLPSAWRPVGGIDELTVEGDG